jgi:2-oxoglutarate dehydrogenase E1 component
MTPKSLLRHPEAVSSLAECASGHFQKVIPDRSHPSGQGMQRILLCSGKIYYELFQKRTELKREDVAILRLEQLYPLPTADLHQALQTHVDGTPVVWVQEEPENMGPWRYLRTQFLDNLLGRFPFRGAFRPASASPATGSHSSHKQEQAKLLHEALDVS